MEGIIKAKTFKLSLLIIISCLFLYMFLPFFTPMLLAALFAFAIEELIQKIKKTNLSRNKLALFSILFLVLFFLTPMILVSVKVFNLVKTYTDGGLQNTELYATIEHLLTQTWQSLTTLLQNFDIDISKLPSLTKVLSDGTLFVAQFITSAVTKLPQILLSLFVFFLSLYFFITDSKNIKKFFLKFKLLTQSELTKTIQIVQKSSYQTMVAAIAVGSVQAFLVAISGYFCGFTEFLIILTITFVFSLIPIIGAAPIAVLLAIILFIKGSIGLGITMLVMSVVVGTVDNILKPILLTSSNKIHPIVSLLALIGGILVYGAPGILIGPILTQLVFYMGPILFPNEIANDDETSST